MAALASAPSAGSAARAAALGGQAVALLQDATRPPLAIEYAPVEAGLRRAAQQIMPRQPGAAATGPSRSRGGQDATAALAPRLAIEALAQDLGRAAAAPAHEPAARALLGQLEAPLRRQAIQRLRSAERLAEVRDHCRVLRDSFHHMLAAHQGPPAAGEVAALRQQAERLGHFTRELNDSIKRAHVHSNEATIKANLLRSTFAAAMAEQRRLL